MNTSIISDVVHAIIPIVLAVAIISFFAGAMWYIFSGDTVHHKQMGMKFIIPAIIATAISLLVLMFV